MFTGLLQRISFEMITSEERDRIIQRASGTALVFICDNASLIMATSRLQVPT